MTDDFVETDFNFEDEEFEQVAAGITAPTEPSPYNSLDPLPYHNPNVQPAQPQQFPTDNNHTFQGNSMVFPDQDPPFPPQYPAYGGAAAPSFAPPQQPPYHHYPPTQQAPLHAAVHGSPALLAAMSANNNGAPVILHGHEIIQFYPNALHFILGCGQFHPLHNSRFRQFMVDYFTQRLQTDESFRESSKHQLAVTAEVERLLAQAAERFGTVMFWDKADKNVKLKSATWEMTRFQNITSDMDRLRKRLNEPLRNTLAKARLPGATNSRDARNFAPPPAPAAPAAAMPVNNTNNKGPKRQRATNDDQYTVQPDHPAPVPLTDADKEALIANGLKEIRDAVARDIQRLEACKEFNSFKREVEFGIIMPRLQRLTSARVVAGNNYTAWTEQWAKTLIPKEERDPEEQAAFDVEVYLQANRLDADRKVCVEYLKIMHRNFEKIGCEEMARQFKPYHLVSILSCTLEMDRAKARFFNFLSGRRGQHWYAKRHIDPESETWFREEWAHYVESQAYEGMPTISKHYVWYFDQDAWGLHEPRYATLRQLLEPQTAAWVGSEEVQLE